MRDAADVLVIFGITGDLEQQWRILQPLLDSPPPVLPYAKGSWGWEKADSLLAGRGRWPEPWIES